jgi:hypothetical protein
MLKALLNKGGAGVSISRTETTEHLNPLLHQLIDLRRHYERLLQSGMSESATERLEALMKSTRNDVTRISETINSMGGLPYNGVDADNPDSPGRSSALSVSEIKDKEKRFLSSLEDQSDTKHQIRTQAVLKNVEKTSRSRMDFLKDHENQNTKV